MPKIVLGESVPEKVYELHIETAGIPNPREAVMLLAEKLYDKFKAKVVWAEVVNYAKIKIQVIGSPFAWALLIPFIPSILNLLAISVILISVYSVIAAIPGWAWALLAVGVVVLLVGPTVGKAFAPLVTG